MFVKIKMLQNLAIIKGIAIASYKSPSVPVPSLKTVPTYSSLVLKLIFKL
jgi:hypothetical protein